MNPNAPCLAILLGSMPYTAPCARCGAKSSKDCPDKHGLAQAAKTGLRRPSKTA
jgi:hypothetical protein